MILRIKAPFDFPHKALAGLAVRDGYHHRIWWIPEEDVEVEYAQASQYKTAEEMLEPENKPEAGGGEPS